MNSRELEEKVALLKDGQRVEIDGHWFRANRIHDDSFPTPCLECNVDCLCHGDVSKVCIELDLMSKSVWYLLLVP